jgi:hypothetical protein
MAEKAKFELRDVPTNTLWKELERRESKEYLRRVRREIRLSREIGPRPRARRRKENRGG